MPQQYGLPYMGSKQKLAERIVAALPAAENLIDLFAGGCAITHRAMLTRKYTHFTANDISDAPSLFLDAISGKYAHETRWISRGDFFRLKDTDPYVRLCWSFGNNGCEYLYSREKEPYKRACHHAVLFNDFAPLYTLCPETAEAVETALKGVQSPRTRRVTLGKTIVRWLKENGTDEMLQANPLYNSCHRKQGCDRLRHQSLQSLERLQRLQSLESLQRLERLQSLERLERLERLTVTRLDYRDVPIPPDSVVYCDVPYFGTEDYGTPFDHAAFYDWCERQTVPLLISEYDMPRDRFRPVAEFRHRSILSATANKAVTERLFTPIHSPHRPLWQEQTLTFT